MDALKRTDRTIQLRRKAEEKEIGQQIENLEIFTDSKTGNHKSEFRSPQANSGSLTAAMESPMESGTYTLLQEIIKNPTFFSQLKGQVVIMHSFPGTPDYIGAPEHISFTFDPENSRISLPLLFTVAQKTVPVFTC